MSTPAPKRPLPRQWLPRNLRGEETSAGRRCRVYVEPPKPKQPRTPLTPAVPMELPQEEAQEQADELEGLLPHWMPDRWTEEP